VTRRSNTIPDDLALLPRWINVILAASVYLPFKYWIPSASFQNPLYKSITMALPNLAPPAGGILLFVAAISAFNAWRKGYIMTETGEDGADGGIDLVLRKGMSV
jgi:hypothetical protein